MGWHINYEVDLQGEIDWDETVVKKGMERKNIDVELMLLRGEVAELGETWTERVVVVVYSHFSIQSVLQQLYKLYPTIMRYRYYGDGGDKWKEFVPTPVKKKVADEDEEDDDDDDEDDC